MYQTAKIFTVGYSQAILLPREFQFDVTEVHIRRDIVTGDVVLSRKPTDWQGLIDVVTLNVEEDLLIGRCQTNTQYPPEKPARTSFFQIHKLLYSLGSVIVKPLWALPLKLQRNTIKAPTPKISRPLLANLGKPRAIQLNAIA